jgi:hypothetical protein
MQEIFTQQIKVVEELGKVLEGSINARKEALGAENTEDGKQKAMDRIHSLTLDMDQRRAELHSMELLQTKTRSQVSCHATAKGRRRPVQQMANMCVSKLRELLDMKQQQANIIEAKAAIRRADESVLQGRSIVMFTVITIFFVSEIHEHGEAVGR